MLNNHLTENNQMQMGEEMDMEASDMMNLNMHHEKLLKTLQECEATCEHMTTHVLRHMLTPPRAKQLELLRDCADICTFTSKYIARNSDSSKYAANLCAYICAVCGNECLKFTDEASQRCAEICHNCSRECKEFSAM
ncbi:MAG: ferredoxin [Clostridia bacterium]|jgi:hypothetical protein|nr:ferredoxin [Clostridia bacterium]